MGEGLLVVVPCGVSKIWKKEPERGPMRAADAYIGGSFKLNRAFAEKYAERWVILSAKYGFISPDFEVPGPYEVTFKRRATNPISVEALRRQVHEQHLDEFKYVIGLGGKDYRAAIRAAFEGAVVHLEFPTAGLRVGEAMAFIKQYEPEGAAHMDTQPHNRQRDLDRFYDLLERLEANVGGKRMLVDCDGKLNWPAQGVYFFFEPGEMRAGGAAPRVVRVGTHAVSRGARTTLWKRLRQHRGTRTGLYKGGGNHRGSIFRLHVGSALLRCRDYAPELHNTWSRGGSAPPKVRQAELPLERDVSEVIGNMPFLWLRAADEASAASIRGVIEKNSVALLSNANKPPLDPPSEDWLGHCCANQAVRESGVWNVNYVYDDYDARFLDDLERLVEEMAQIP